MLTRIISFTYGGSVLSDLFGTFLYAIGFVAGGNLYVPGQNLLVPRSIDVSPAGAGEPLAQRIIIDAVLLSLFAIQHSVMARQWFKRRWTKIVAPMLERSTYVLLASLTLLLMFWQWRPIGASAEHILWDLQNPAARLVLQSLFWIGWGTVLISTFLIDHFDLFGLKQAYCYLRGTDCPAPAFKTPAFYRGVRHPIYLGFIIAFWSTPRMSMGHLFFAVMTTAYMVVAIQFEERDMLRAHGELYADYKKRVSMLAPISFMKGRSESTETKQQAAKP